MLAGYEQYVNHPYDRLVIKDVVRKQGEPYAFALCKCGGVKETLLRNITKGLTRSCGCIKKDQAAKARESLDNFESGNNLSGQTLNGWLAIEVTRKTKNNLKYYECQCIECGSKKEIRSGHLKAGATRCNNCQVAWVNPYRKGQEGDKSNPLWQRWLCLIDRCYRPSADNYQYYGAKGVVVCEEWLATKIGFKNFESWALTNYPNVLELLEAGYQVDRENPFGNYEPNNCRFLTNDENQRNKKEHVRVNYYGKSYVLRNLWEAEDCQIAVTTVIARLKSGWPTHLALITPVGVKRVQAVKDYPDAVNSGGLIKRKKRESTKKKSTEIATMETE